MNVQSASEFVFDGADSKASSTTEKLKSVSFHHDIKFVGVITKESM